MGISDCLFLVIGEGENEWVAWLKTVLSQRRKVGKVRKGKMPDSILFLYSTG